MIVSPRFVAWVLGGAALDATILINMCMSLHALGPLASISEYWLTGVCLVAVPWLVHVLLLPRLFHVVPPEMCGIGWLVRSMVFMLSSALLIPMLGIMAFFFIWMPWFLFVTWGTSQTGVSHRIWLYEINGDVVFIFIAVAVGAAMGLLLHITRRGDLSGAAVPPNEPSFRSDVLGGGLAAGLVFVGLFIGQALGWFSPSTDGSEEWAANTTLLSNPAAIVVIGTLAMLPHVIMIGWELPLRPTRSRP